MFRFLSARSRPPTHQWLSTGILFLGTLFLAPRPMPPANAVEFPNGQIAFDRPPRLIRTTSSFKHHRSSASVYHFILEVPADAGEPLKVVEIEQPDRSLETIVFQPEATRAFLGNKFKGGPELSLAEVGGTTAPGKVTVVFETPVPPGSTVTVSIKPERNPFRGGVYLFEITAFPAGEDSLGQSLGYGRFHIYD